MKSINIHSVFTIVVALACVLNAALFIFWGVSQQIDGNHKKAAIYLCLVLLCVFLINNIELNKAIKTLHPDKPDT